MLLEDSVVGLEHIRCGEIGTEVQVREGLTLGLPATGEAACWGQRAPRHSWFRALRAKGLS